MQSTYAVMVFMLCDSDLLRFLVSVFGFMTPMIMPSAYRARIIFMLFTSDLLCLRFQFSIFGLRSIVKPSAHIAMIIFMFITKDMFSVSFLLTWVHGLACFSGPIEYSCNPHTL